MKKIYLFLFLLTLNSVVVSQDTVRIKNKNYTTVFSKTNKYPVLVEWWVTRAKVTCAKPIPRKDKFKPDPKLPEHTNLELDYKGSGLDRGHMSPAADNQCQSIKEMEESFYFSNMSPQYHSLNAGDWKTVEVFTRELAKDHDSVHVWSGNIGVSKKIGRVSVPKECWKVIYVKKTNEWYSFMFNNTKDKPTGLKSHEVPKEIVEKVTGFKFNK
jgi:endonuclease G